MLLYPRCYFHRSNERKLNLIFYRQNRSNEPTTPNLDRCQPVTRGVAVWQHVGPAPNPCRCGVGPTCNRYISSCTRYAFLLVRRSLLDIGHAVIHHLFIFRKRKPVEWPPHQSHGENLGSSFIENLCAHICMVDLHCI